MQEQGSGGGESTMLRTRPNTIIRGEVQGEYVVRGAKIKCSKALKEEAYDVVNLPLCHGVYSGKEPLINIKDMKDGENIVNGFGICSETGGPCVDEMKFHINWINRKKIRLHIEGEEAVTTNSFTMCSTHGGEITFENSGQTAVFAPKNERNKEDLMGEEARDKTMDSMISLMACEKGLKDLSHQWFEASGNPKKQKALHEQANKIREHMVYLAESSPVKPEVLMALKSKKDYDASKFNPNEVLLKRIADSNNTNYDKKNESISYYGGVSRNKVVDNEHGIDDFLGRVVEAEAGLGRGIGIGFKILGAEAEAKYMQTHDITFEKSNFTSYQNIEGALGVNAFNIFNVGLSEQYKRDSFDSQNMMNYGNGDPFYGILEDPITKKSHSMGLTYKNHAIVGSSDGMNEDVKLTLLGVDLAVGIGGKASIGLNLSEAKKFFEEIESEQKDDEDYGRKMFQIEK